MSAGAPEKSSEKAILLRVIGAAFTLVFILLSALAKPGSTYRVSFLSLSVVFWLIYFLRRKISLHPLHFLLYGFALFFHNLGVFGLYRSKFAGLEFDFYVHTYFSVAVSLMLYRAFRDRLGFQRWVLWAGVVLVLMALGALHEIMEYLSNVLLGPEKGMLKVEAGPFDTQEDLIHDGLGAIIAVVIYAGWERWKK